MKTDAPWSVIWRVMREWARQKSPVKLSSITPGMAAYRLLKLEEQGEKPEREEKNRTSTELEAGAVVFDEAKGRYKEKKLVRYQHNPRENWGPMTRAKGK